MIPVLPDLRNRVIDYDDGESCSAFVDLAKQYRGQWRILMITDDMYEET